MIKGFIIIKRYKTLAACNKACEKIGLAGIGGMSHFYRNRWVIEVPPEDAKRARNIIKSRTQTYP